jgi:hypothetical protein
MAAYLLSQFVQERALIQWADTDLTGREYSITKEFSSDRPLNTQHPHSPQSPRMVLWMSIYTVVVMTHPFEGILNLSAFSNIIEP